MDIVLEVADNFIFDHIYSHLLPAFITTLAANATVLSIREEPTGFAVPATAWQYEPASKYFSLQPSQAAYESAWPRDDWRRQLLTLYLITWQVIPGLCFGSTSDIVQAVWRPRLLCLCIRVLLLRLRQGNVRPPSLPQEPNYARDEAGKHRVSHHGHLYRAMVSS